MCGISGFFNNQKKKIDKDLLRKLSVILNHRGPDHSGLYYNNHIGLAHNRLSILDLSEKGNQPFSNERYYLVYNGEIYNYKYLKNDLKRFNISFRSSSDTEVLFYYLIHFGVSQTLANINGMFAFAFFDNKKNKLFLSRDRLGIKPLFYCIQNNTLFFASEMKALVKNLDFKIDNVKALYSTLGIIEKSRYETPYEGLFHVRPGTYLEFNLSGLKEKKYFDLIDLIDEKKYNIYKKRSFSDNRDEFQNIFSSSVKKMLMSDAPMGAFVSGGIDSNLVALEALRFSNNDFQLFTANIIGKYSEYDDAIQLSKQLDLELNDYCFKPEYFLRDFAKATWFYETPIVVHSNAIPFSNVAYLANASGIKAVLTGEGSDELFMGYPRLLTKRFDNIIRAPYNFLNEIYSLFPSLKRYMSGGGSSGIEILFEKASQNFTRDLIREEGLKKLEFLNEPRRKEHYLTIQMLNEGLVSLLWRNDRMGMMHSIESRFPFLDEKILAFAINLPISNKIGYTSKFYNYKHPFLLDKKIVRYSAKSRLTNNLVYKKKDGFPCYGLGNLKIQPDLFKKGYVFDLLKLNTSKQIQYFSENFDNYHIAKFAALEVWGSLFVLNKSVETVQNRINNCIKMHY